MNRREQWRKVLNFEVERWSVSAEARGAGLGNHSMAGRAARAAAGVGDPLFSPEGKNKCGHQYRCCQKNEA